MSCEVNGKQTQQNEIMELLQQDLMCANQELRTNAELTACLERDLENAIIQMQMNYLEGRM